MANYLIIGASSGIGKALALQLAASGHDVYGTYHTSDPSTLDARIRFSYLDVTKDSPSFDALPPTLSGVIYCPGSINLRPFERMKPEDYLRDYDLQVIGAIRVLQATISRMKTSDNAAIILYSTVAVQSGLPFHSQVSASKGAIEGLTRALAAEYAPKIRVNCIAPSLTDTPLAAPLLNTDQKKEASAQRHALRRVGTPDDIANMAAFLLSEQASWITGQVLHVDGGMSSLKV